MKYGLVNGHRSEAQPGFSGQCPVCSSRLIAKCGEQRVWHWAHHGKRTCDRWWEPETQWHRAWKNHFPDDWQEVIHWAEDGEKHIADIKIEDGRVLEIQHSYLAPEERRAREAFYQRMVWIVNGHRRKSDWPRFRHALTVGDKVQEKPLMLRIPVYGCAILNEWADSRVPVFLDFGDAVIWRLDPESSKVWAVVARVHRKDVIEAYGRATAGKDMADMKAIEHTDKLAQARNLMMLQQRRRSRRF
jgi:hypothetical protein